jgi:hypothetical protein
MFRFTGVDLKFVLHCINHLRDLVDKVSAVISHYIYLVDKVSAVIVYML